MTHITQEQAVELARKTKMRDQLWLTTEEEEFEAVHDFANAAIRTYLDSLSTELPGATTLMAQCQLEGKDQCCNLENCSKRVYLYSKDKLLQALAARDAKWQWVFDRHLENEKAQMDRANKAEAEHDAMKKQHVERLLRIETKVDTLIAERDAAIEMSKKWQALCEGNIKLNESLTKAQSPFTKNYTTGHCNNHKLPGGCPLHNVQCGYPECDRKTI